MDTAAFDPTQECCTHDIVLCSPGSPPLAFRSGHLPVLRLKAFHTPSANNSSLRRRAASSGTTRPYNTSCACLTLACTRNMDENSVTSMSPSGNASEKIACLPALTPSFLKTQPCEPMSWTQAANFSRNLALTTSYGASGTGPTPFLHASRPCGTA